MTKVKNSSSYALKFLRKKEDGTYELSPESTVQITLMMLFLYAAQIIANRFVRILGDSGVRGYFIQEQKQRLTKALECCKNMVSHLELGYDAQFDKLLGGRDERYSVVQFKSNWLIRLCLLALSRCDKNDKMYSIIPSEIASHEGAEDYSVSEAVEYYNND